MPLPAKALVSQAGGLTLFDDPVTGKRLAQISLDTKFAFDGSNVSLAADVVIDPADSSSVTGIITRPISKNLTDDNFAQTVRAVLTAKKADGTYMSLKCTDDGRLMVKVLP